MPPPTSRPILGLGQMVSRRQSRSPAATGPVEGAEISSPLKVEILQSEPRPSTLHPYSGPPRSPSESLSLQGPAKLSALLSRLQLSLGRWMARRCHGACKRYPKEIPRLTWDLVVRGSGSWSQILGFGLFSSCAREEPPRSDIFWADPHPKVRPHHPHHGAGWLLAGLQGKAASAGPKLVFLGMF